MRVESSEDIPKELTDGMASLMGGVYEDPRFERDKIKLKLREAVMLLLFMPAIFMFACILQMDAASLSVAQAYKSLYLITFDMLGARYIHSTV